jgi:DeoR family fructose operon transcriptional repressor
MKQEYRRKAILQMLDKNELVSIKDIVKLCSTSEMTARRDLDLLEQKGMLIRTHGGAVLPSVTMDLFGFDKKSELNKQQKTDICKRASTFIEENDTIYMDCGTTVYYMARFLTRFKNLRVITNSLPLVSELMPYSQIRVYLIGGELDNERMASYGPMTDNLLSRYKADKAFIGAGGVSLENGLSSVDEKEASVTTKMAEAANKIFLLCDSSKIERNSYFTYSSLSNVDYLITDRGIKSNHLESYRNNRINVIIA